jgi:hypothetical protein
MSQEEYNATIFNFQETRASGVVRKYSIMTAKVQPLKQLIQDLKGVINIAEDAKASDIMFLGTSEGHSFLRPEFRTENQENLAQITKKETV